MESGHEPGMCWCLSFPAWRAVWANPAVGVAEKAKPLLSNTCSRARLPGSARSLYSVEEFQGHDSSTLIQSALGWDESHPRPPDLVSACYLGSLTQAQMCTYCRVNPAVSHQPEGLNPDALAPLFSWHLPTPLLPGICQWRLKERGRCDFTHQEAKEVLCLFWCCPCHKMQGLGGTPVYPAAYSPESCEQLRESC